MPAALPFPSAPTLDTVLLPSRTVESDLFALLQALHARGYTGSLTLHFVHGVAKIAELPPPQIKLT